MSWSAIAKKDFRDARRAKMLWGATGVFVFFFGLLLLPLDQGGDSAAEAAREATTVLLFPAGFFLPLVVISMAYLAIAGERSSGSIKYLLGLPNSRGEVLLGKFIGRAAIASIAVALAVAVGAVLLFVKFGTATSEYLIFATMTLYLALVFTAIAVGVSALAATRGKAMAGTIGIYFVFGVLWIIPGINPQDSVSYLVEDLLGMGPAPEFYEFVQNISPVIAYFEAANGFINGAPDDVGSADFHPAAADTPWYLTDDFLLVVLLAWLVVPLALGYWRFSRAELG